jgi:hypothetical protein
MACNDATRADLARLVAHQLPQLTTVLVSGDPFGYGHAQPVAPPLAQLVHQALPVVERVCRQASRAGSADVVPFRFLGAVCAHQAVEQDEASAVLSGAVEAVADFLLARGREFDDLWGAENVDQAVTVICGQLEDFASRALPELEKGYARMNANSEPPTAEEASTYLELLQARGEAEATAAPFPESVLHDGTPRSIAVLVATGHRDDAPALAHAAQEIEVHLPGAVDLGMGDDHPTHWRVVIPRPASAEWRDMHGVLRHIAMTHGLVILVRYPGVGVAALRSTYRDTLTSLPEAIAAYGRRSAVVSTHAPTGPRTPAAVAA